MNNSSLIDQLARDQDIEKLQAILKKMSGFEIANYLSNKTEEEKEFVFKSLPLEISIETFDYLPFKSQIKVLQSLSSSQAANLLAGMPPDDRTSFLEELPQEVVDDYIKLLSPSEKFLSQTLLGYPEDSVGRLMTTDYVAVKMDWSAEQVLDHIRNYGHDSETINVIYVVDDNDKLLDDIKIKDFLFVPKDYKVSQIGNKKFIALSVLDKSQNAINIFKQYDRVALPVVDELGCMLGIVTIDDILRLASEKNTANVQQIGGTEALDAPYLETPFFELMKKRARWLVLLFIGEMFTATAMGFFEWEISKAVVLALFLPLIISSGGNAGSQSTTLIIRAMALGEVKLKDWWRIMKREIYSGLFLGGVLGMIGFLRVTIWSSFSTIYGEHWILIAFTIAVALVGVVLWGSFTGSMLPFLLRKFGADPATASAPLVATIVDVTGIIIYFLTASQILKGTLL